MRFVGSRERIKMDRNGTKKKLNWFQLYFDPWRIGSVHIFIQPMRFFKIGHVILNHVQKVFIIKFKVVPYRSDPFEWILHTGTERNGLLRRTVPIRCKLSGVDIRLYVWW